MQELLKNLLDQLKQSSAASKVTALLVATALIVAAGVAGVVASKPHFEMLYSGLSAAESAAIQKALSEGGIVYEVSQPPGPFVIFVADGSRYEAQNLVAGAGALERIPKGIPGSESGASTIFMSASERAQLVRKREWEETQGMLEALDFVEEARVRTSAPDASPFGKQVPVTASVTLNLRPGTIVDKVQAESIANLVRYGLGISRENLVISDHSGNSIYDGTSELKPDSEVEDWIGYQESHDRKLEERVNQMLATAFGPGLAKVSVNTEWNFERKITQSEQAENTKAIVSDSTKKSKTPQGASTVGGGAGTASNLDTGDGSQAIGPVEFAETEDKRTEYIPSWTSTEVRQLAPELERLSVSLMLDESLQEKRAELEQVVQAAVGFDSERGDVFQSMPITFYKEEVPEGAATGEEAEGGSSPMLENVLGKATEIAAALAFVVLLFRSVKSSKQEAAAEAASSEAAQNELDPEELAQAQIEELLQTDPGRVSEILADWVREESSVKSA